MYPHNKKLTTYAQELRKNMTKEERHLWFDFLVHFPIVVKKQYVIDNYILDFLFQAKKSPLKSMALNIMSRRQEQRTV